MSIREKEDGYGCVFCRTGYEHRVAEEICEYCAEIRTIVPVKQRYRRQAGQLLEETVILFPGYVFFRARMDLEVKRALKGDNVFKLLYPSENSWALTGEDRALVEMLFRSDGRIGFSTAYYEGGRIRIIDGFLKNYEGSIIRVNHRAKTAQVKVKLNDKDFLLWIGFELVEDASQTNGVTT